MKNTLSSLNNGNFAKFCLAVSFALFDLQFLVQQSLSLTLQPLRPTLAKVNKTYEQYRHYNSLVTVLLFGKIPKTKFLLSCTSKISGGLENTTGQRYSLHIQSTLPNCYNGLLRILLFPLPKLILHSFESLFFRNTYTFIYFQLVLYLQLVGSQGAFKILPLEVQLARLVDFSQFLLWFAPNFTFLHSKLQSQTPWNYILQEYIVAQAIPQGSPLSDLTFGVT